MIMNKQKVIKELKDAMEYWSFRLEELKSDDIHYINAMWDYIHLLEKELNQQS
jgi:hypothetical protein|tara:strand:+ start:73 stop:231 length:159 start_codon:yes stop_codon:yes gene_type:complete